MANRAIKFRAWDGIRMTTSGIMFNTSTGSLEVPSAPSFNPTGKLIDSYRLMQFTGILDKNGKEIYEGDLVKHDAWEYPFEVIYDQEKARFVCAMKKRLTQSINGISLTVVGNIFENKDLLTPTV